MILSLVFCATFSPVSAVASTIGLNFTDNGSADSTMASTDLAGAPAIASTNWNNLLVNGGGPSSDNSLNYGDGSAVVGASVDWQSDLGNWRLDHAVTDGHDRMWKGYLDVQNSGTVNVSGLSFVGAYDVYIYFDGANAAQWRIANFAIGATSAFGEDSENTSWGAGQNAGKVYQLPVAGAGGNQPFPTSPNNSEGNYVLLSGISGSAFTLDITNGPTAGTARAPINGIQIVGVIPEPSSALLAGLAGLFVLRRRRD